MKICIKKREKNALTEALLYKNTAKHIKFMHDDRPKGWQYQ